jgi:phage major head subunit gpT-like protein
MPVTNTQVDIFTNSMRSEFLNSYTAVAEPAPYEKVTQRVNSTVRTEHFTWMSPTPGIGLYQGHRRYGVLDPIRYSVENKEFDAAFEVLLRDIEDDQTGGYALKPKELAMKAKMWPGRRVLKTLSLGTSTTCFDGSNFFANSHTIGTGDNLLTYDAASNDSTTHKIVALYTGGLLKPLIWLDRKAPNFQTDSGTPESFKAKRVRYWIDLEGEAAFGYWWDAIHVTVTDTPTVAEVHSIFANIEAAFRSFRLPTSLSSDEQERPHEQVVFSASNLCMVHSTTLAEVMRQALNGDWVPQATAGATSAVATTNRFRGFADSFPTHYLDS